MIGRVLISGAATSSTISQNIRLLIFYQQREIRFSRDRSFGDTAAKEQRVTLGTAQSPVGSIWFWTTRPEEGQGPLASGITGLNSFTENLVRTYGKRVSAAPVSVEGIVWFSLFYGNLCFCLLQHINLASQDWRQNCDPGRDQFIKYWIGMKKSVHISNINCSVTSKSVTMYVQKYSKVLDV